MIDPFSTATKQTQGDIAYQSWSAAGKRAAMRYDVNDRTAGPMPVFQRLVLDTAITAQSYGTGNALSADARPDIVLDPEAEDGYSFADVIDVVNPLQHLPVIGTIYRKITGDTIKPMSLIIGGGIFGGPVGAVASTVNVIVKDRTGRDVAENAFALAGFDMTSRSPRPHLTYDAPLNAEGQPQEFMASANEDERRTANGHRNFAARAYATAGSSSPLHQSWNA